LRLRQIALMCRDLEAVVGELEAVLGLEVAASASSNAGAAMAATW
jgi:hypothetical protein